jgi:transcriptional regulator with XRE-family HTH domain
MSRDAFGPNLRRIRIQKQVSIEQIAKATKLLPSLFQALERNDFSHWPTGVYARSYVRQYAEAIGVDADSTVDEFCRWFPEGDRRLERTVREQAEIVGHENLEWRDVPPADLGDRRGAEAVKTMSPTLNRPTGEAWVSRIRRVLRKA